MPDSPEKVDQLVMVVHGVGDPAPGETLSKLARSIAGPNQPLTETQQVLWLDEPSENEDQVATFPCHVRNLKFASGRVKLSEVFWGDISRVRNGAIGVITGLFEILFGLRYVGYVAADQPGRPAQLLKRLGILGTRMVHGPVLAVCLMLAMLTLAVAVSEVIWTDSHKSLLWTHVLLAGSCGVTLIVASIGYRLTRIRAVKRFWFWADIVVMFVAGLMVIQVTYLNSVYAEAFECNDVMCGLIWYCRVLVVMLGMLWFSEICVMLAAGACWLVACLDPRTYKPALHVAFLMPAITVGFWGLALPITWLSAAKFLRRFVELGAFEDIFHEAVPMMGVQVVMGSLVFVTAIISLLNYVRWRKANAVVNPQMVEGSPPRMIVAPQIQLVIAVCTVIGVAFVAFLGVMQLMGQAYEKTWLGLVMAEANSYAIAGLLPTAFLLFLVLPHLRPVLDIVLDVVNHFHFRDTELEDLLNDEDEFDINETTFDSGRLFFFRRDAIHVRFKSALAHFRDKLDGRPKLTIISHSQGTMVAIEVLNDPELHWLKNKFESITLVTMGSPFTHLYQHYFAHFYPALDSEQWQPLVERLERWINIYRIDDFVGTQIDFPMPRIVPTQDCPDGAFSNYPVGPRGHMNYWADAHVLDILRRELMGVEDQQDLEEFRFRQSAA